MTCKPCEERRRALFDAFMAGKMAEALGHAAKGAAELVGLKGKENGSGKP